MADTGRSPSPQHRSERTRLVVGAIVVIVLIAFVLDNRRTVKIGFVVGNHETRLIYVLIVTALLGAVLGVVLDRLWLRRGRN